MHRSVTDECLPVNLEEARARGWGELDVVIVSGDAYVDHPSFGAAVIGRALEAAGFRVGILPQPRIDHPEDFRALGRPRLFFAVAPGNVDSMIIHYTALKRVRNDDPYTPGGRRTRRPKRAPIAYTAAIKHAWKGVPVVIGGTGPSTRRLTHYDYWDGGLRRSVLLDSKADLLVWGMGERQVVEIARRLAEGEPVSALTDVPGTVWRSKERPAGATELPSFEECRASDEAFIEHFRLLDAAPESRFAERAGDWWVVQNEAPPPMTTAELDAVYELPFTRREHLSHLAEGGVPALRTVLFSVVSHRGCFADCSFCSIAVHQGRRIVMRSVESVVREVERIASDPRFRGTITDVGGPSANMYGMRCRKGGCAQHRCLGREPCPHLDTDHSKWLELLEAAARVEGVKHVFVGSGLRYDLLMCLSDAALERLVRDHVGGQLKVAPEHASERVLRLMRKPPWREYLRFRRRFYRAAERAGVKRHVLPYVMTSHPGTELEDEWFLLRELERTGFVPDQVQDFIPLPMTRSSVMFHTGRDPVSGERVPVARDRKEKERHFAVLRPKEKRYRPLHERRTGERNAGPKKGRGGGKRGRKKGGEGRGGRGRGRPQP